MSESVDNNTRFLLCMCILLVY